MNLLVECVRGGCRVILWMSLVDLWVLRKGGNHMWASLKTARLMEEVSKRLLTGQLTSGNSLMAFHTENTPKSYHLGKHTWERLMGGERRAWGMRSSQMRRGIKVSITVMFLTGKGR